MRPTCCEGAETISRAYIGKHNFGLHDIPLLSIVSGDTSPAVLDGDVFTPPPEPRDTRCNVRARTKGTLFLQTSHFLARCFYTILLLYSKRRALGAASLCLRTLCQTCFQWFWLLGFFLLVFLRQKALPHARSHRRRVLNTR